VFSQRLRRFRRRRSSVIEVPTIRAASPSDAAAVAEIYGWHVRTGVATFDLEPPSAENWAKTIAATHRDGWPFAVAVLSERVVGFAYAAQWRAKPGYRHTVEDTIYLAPSVVGRGLGRALLSRVLEECAAAGARQVLAVIADSGEAASLALHRSFGFKKVGRLAKVGVKFGREIDTVLLQVSLDDQIAAVHS
jgi:L-amino acid N-acyltransferase YncA